MTTCEPGHPEADELMEWFHELERLVEEAKARFGAGDVRPALASLAAVPPVHRLLVDGCGLFVAPETPADDVESARTGLYL